MTAPEAATTPQSRRALLGGLVGGLGAWVASAVGRAAPVEAAAGDPIRMGRVNRAGGTSTELQTKTSKPAFWARQLGGGHALRAEAGSGRAVMASAGTDGTGVWAYSPNHYGVLAYADGNSGVGVSGRSETGTGVLGVTIAGTAVRGWLQSEGGGYAVHGYVDGGTKLAAALVGESVGGAWAGKFVGDVQVKRVLELLPMSLPPEDPPYPGDGLQLFARVNIAGKVELCVTFGESDVQVIATQA